MNGKTPLVENGHGHHNGAIDGALAGEAASKKDE
jgi:hypothetical protein